MRNAAPRPPRQNQTPTPPPPLPAWAAPSVVVPVVGLVLAAVVGALSGGLAGTFVVLALVVLVGAAWHLATDKPFLKAPGRKLGVGLLTFSLVSFGVGGAFAAAGDDDPAEPEAAATQTPGEPRPSTTPTTARTTATARPTPLPTPTPEDLADPDDAALNADAAAALPAPAPAASSDTGGVLARASGQTALVALAQLGVDAHPDGSGYDRDAFGYRAFDTDRNGCDTRNDILRRDLAAVTLEPGTQDCVVLSGSLADPYSGTTIAFTRGTATSNDVQIDHVVALGDAWQSGARTWSDDRRHQLGNDPLNLLAVSGPLNAQKGDSAADGWLPPDVAYRCAYVARQVGVKLTYGLTVRPSERDAMAAVLSSCPDQPLPHGSALPTPASPPPTTKAPAPAATTKAANPPPARPAAPAPTADPAPAPVPVVPPAPAAVYYDNCTAVWNAIGRSLLIGEPGYEAPRLDRDRDGVACEEDPR